MGDKFWMKSTERRLTRAIAAAQVALIDLVDCSVDEKKQISMEISALEKIHNDMGECIKQLKKEYK